MDSKRNLFDARGDADIERAVRDTLALIICDDPCANLGSLLATRCKAALPFAGKYRLIDLALSNCVNSGIDLVGVITQYKPRSLYTHLSYGRPWDLDRRQGGLTLLHPYQGRSAINWYAGSANAILQNWDYVRHHAPAHVLVLLGSQASTLDFAPLIAQHERTGAHLTIVTAEAAQKTACHHHSVVSGEDGIVRELCLPGSGSAAGTIISGPFVFNAQVLRARLEEDDGDVSSAHDLVEDLAARMIAAGDRVLACPHAGYWNGLRTVHDYWQCGMDLVEQHPQLNLQDASWPIRTQPEIRPPTRVSSSARVAHSLIGEGCVIDGTIESSVLSPGVCIAPGAVVRHSVVMHDTSIEERAVVEHAILDMDVTVGPQAHVGHSDRQAPTVQRQVPIHLAVVGKGVHVPAHKVVVPNVPSGELILTQSQQLTSDHASLR